MITDHALRLQPTPVGLRAIGPWLADAMAALAPEQVQARFGAIELAVHELAANSIEHALAGVAECDRRLAVQADVEPDRVVVTVIDRGRPFEPCPTAGPETGYGDGSDGDAPDGHPPAVDGPAVGGYGLMIIHGVASSVEYRRVDGDNRWTAVFAV